MEVTFLNSIAVFVPGCHLCIDIRWRCCVKDKERGFAKMFMDTDSFNKEKMEERMKKYGAQLSKYIRVRDPDKAMLSELVIKAKGPARSMRQFASDLGVNPSTLSRIVNMQTAGANKDTLIADIAEKADPESGVTFEKLMEAHGMEKQQYNNKIELFSRFEQRCRMVIQDELLKRGYSISAMQEGRGKDIYDILIKTDAVSHGEGRWAFDFKMFSSDPRISGIPVGMGRTRQCVDRIMSKFYTETAEADKVSVVVERRQIFEQLKSMYSNICIPDEISFILISGNQVAEEYVIPMKEREEKVTFFPIEEKTKTPAWMDMSDESNADVGEYEGDTE